MVDRSLLDEQLDYYKERAAEYDEWWERRGRFDRGPDANSRWFAEIDAVRAVFDDLPLNGDVLELAPGTGYWTELLARRADGVTAPGRLGRDDRDEPGSPRRPRLAWWTTAGSTCSTGSPSAVTTGSSSASGSAMCREIACPSSSRCVGTLSSGARPCLPRRTASRGEYGCRSGAARPSQRGDDPPAQRRSPVPDREELLRTLSSCRAGSRRRVHPADRPDRHLLPVRSRSRS